MDNLSPCSMGPHSHHITSHIVQQVAAQCCSCTVFQRKASQETVICPHFAHTSSGDRQLGTITIQCVVETYILQKERQNPVSSKFSTIHVTQTKLF